MNFEIISTGDEVITGLTVDTNAAWLSTELLSLGIQPRFRSTCGDDPDDICNLIKERSNHADVIFVNGGLGPTTDDNTSASAAKAAGVKLVRHEEWVKKIEAWHAKRNRSVNPVNLKQADLPETAVMIDNPNGTACGFSMKINRALCFFTPGVPHEFKSMYRDFIKPYLIKHCPNLQLTEVKRFFCFGIPESDLQSRMNTLNFPKNIIIGYRASYPIMELKLISHGAQKDEIAEACKKIREQICGVLVCEDNFDCADLIAKKIGTAEVNIFDSMTSGQIALNLSESLNIKKALAVKSPYDPDLEKILDEKDCSYFISLLNQEENKAMRLIFKSKIANITKIFNVALNITIKNKSKDAYTLAALMLILRVLNKEEIPELVIGEISEEK